MSNNSKKIHSAVRETRDQHLRRLRDGCRTSFAGLNSLQGWIADELELLDATTSWFTVTESALADQPAYQPTLETDPSAIRTGTNLIGHVFNERSSSLLLYAHADTDPVAAEHVRAGHGVSETEDRIVAPGIADDVSGLTAILSAIEVVADSSVDPVHTVTVGSILGKQCGIAGTYELVRQYDPTDSAVYVHPAESGTGLSEIKVGSNGVIEFVITVYGQQPETSELHHTLFTTPGQNPISVVTRLGRRLEEWSDTLAKRHRNPAIEELAGRSAGVHLGGVDVDGTAVYRVPETCTLRGVISFPPGAQLTTVQGSFEEMILSFVAAEPGLTTDRIDVEWGDLIADAAQTDLNSPIADRAAMVLESVTGRTPSWYYGHAASDIRYPMQYWETESLGFGPRAGDMGKPTEWIDRGEYLDTITALARLITTPIE